MKERIIIDEDFYVKHFQEREIEFQEEDMCSGGNPEEWWHYKKEQVPETFADLTELCKKYSGKGLYIGCSYIEVDGVLFYSNMVFCNDGAIFLNTDCCFKEKATPAQMWQIIKSLIGEE